MAIPRTGQELFLPYADFPWFKDQSVSVIVNMEEQDLLVFDYTQELSGCDAIHKTSC
ncbi:hypothetical protein [Endozoicomonas sp. Mp262]|uniref:hypothetical protein n=1 Tax=Endozoicomonas sp. Mp262 TaxID=2919499 RepID=UPI0021D9B47D